MKMDGQERRATCASVTLDVTNTGGAFVDFVSAMPDGMGSCVLLVSERGN